MLREGNGSAMDIGDRDMTAQMRRKVMVLAWPAIAEMFLMTLTQIVDTAMVGRLGGTAITAVGLTMAPMMLFMGMLVIRLSLALLLGIYLGMGLFGIWLAMAVDLYFRGFLFYRRFRSGSWKTIKV